MASDNLRKLFKYEPAETAANHDAQPSNDDDYAKLPKFNGNYHET